jgi:hypothetical protein
MGNTHSLLGDHIDDPLLSVVADFVISPWSDRWHGDAKSAVDGVCIYLRVYVSVRMGKSDVCE